ncbi:hypothetical protein GKS22_02140 [Streptococcus uberis]|nr:hypothetical protein [Streptococcus uberis]MTB42535.1 hypothetical protein [Streptococcus uberis]
MAKYMTKGNFYDSKDKNKYYGRAGLEYTGSQSKARLEQLDDYIEKVEE